MNLTNTFLLLSIFNFFSLEKLWSPLSVLLLIVSNTTAEFVLLFSLILVSLTANSFRNLIYKVLNLGVLSILVAALWAYFTDLSFIYVVYILAFVGAVVMLFLSVILMLPSSAVAAASRVAAVMLQYSHNVSDISLIEFWSHFWSSLGDTIISIAILFIIKIPLYIILIVFILEIVYGVDQVWPEPFSNNFFDIMWRIIDLILEHIHYLLLPIIYVVSQLLAGKNFYQLVKHGYKTWFCVPKVLENGLFSLWKPPVLLMWYIVVMSARWVWNMGIFSCLKPRWERYLWKRKYMPFLYKRDYAYLANELRIWLNGLLKKFVLIVNRVSIPTNVITELFAQVVIFVSVFLLAVPYAKFNYKIEIAFINNSVISGNLENLSAIQHILYIDSPIFMIVSVTGLLVALIGAASIHKFK